MEEARGELTAAESLLIITGTMGSGKSTVMAEVSDILGEMGVVHTVIDMDALGVAHLGSAARNDEIMYRNLESVYRNCAEAGIRRFLLARAVENRAALERICGIIPAKRTRVCRLSASIEEMQRRVARRETGMLQSALVEWVGELSAILDRAALEDFSVINENCSVNDSTRQILVRAGWI